MDIQLVGVSNYAVWGATVRTNLRTAKLWGYVDGSILSQDKGIVVTETTSVDKSTSSLSYAAAVGTTSKDKGTLVSSLQTWADIDEIVMGYIFRSVDPSIRLDLLEFTTSRAQWTYLSKRYVQSSGAREYQLRSELDSLRQGELSIQDFFSCLRRIWSELDAMHATGRISTCSCSIQRDRQYLYYFLMRLRPEFEALRAQLLHRSPLPSLDDALTELIAEETRLRALSSATISPESVFTASLHVPRPQPPATGSSRHLPLFETPTNRALSKDTSTDLSQIECRYCHRRGHVKANCPALHRRRSRQARPIAATAESASLSETTTAPSATPDMAQLSSQVQQLQQLLQTAGFLSEPSAMSASTGTDSTWILDSGASHHMTSCGSLLVDCSPVPSDLQIRTADGTSLSVSQCGSITPSSDSSGRLTLSPVLHVPKLSMNLISISRLADSGYTISFTSSSCFVQDPHTGRRIGTGRRMGNLYRLESLHLPPSAPPTLCSSGSVFSAADLWHRRLGHPSEARLKLLFQTGVLGSQSSSFRLSHCESCKLAKHSALPFSIRETVSSNPFDLVHSDIWGPSPLPSMTGFLYYVSFIDDCTRFTWVYLMHRRSDLSSIYRQFSEMIHTQFHCRIKILRTDGAREYLSTELRDILFSHGTLPQ